MKEEKCASDSTAAEGAAEPVGEVGEKEDGGGGLHPEKVKEECMPSDLTKPLTIETKFGGASSSGPSSESTDTASEMGSGFSSPGSVNASSCQSSPHFHGEGRYIVFIQF